MQVREGYKQTEVGVIPEDWQIRTLGEVGDVKMCKRIFKNQTQVTGDIPFYKIGTFGSSPDAFISEALFNEYKSKFSFPKKGDVLISAAGTIGRTVIYDGSPAYFQDSNIIWIDNDQTKVSNDYIWHFYKIIKWSVSHGGIVARLYNANIKSIQVYFPNHSEQSAIATALSDVNELLSAQDKLIAKKRDIKQAAMQQLLTGKQRLPGFTGEWEVKLLGDVVEIRKGQLITEKDAVAGSVPVIAGGKKPAYYHNKSNRTGKTITVSASGASAGYVAFFHTAIFASDCSTINEGQTYSIEFIFFQLQLKQVVIYKAQTGGAQPHIHAVDLMPIEIGCPSLPEQNAIATVLSDMDADLAALEQQRDKTRDIKQGMMQELLTGRIRLV